jgi:hypothetical protein
MALVQVVFELLFEIQGGARVVRNGWQTTYYKNPCYLDRGVRLRFVERHPLILRL